MNGSGIKNKMRIEMPSFSTSNLHQRNLIIKTQQLFWTFLDLNIINVLIHLFDMNTKEGEKIVKYIEDERKIRGLDMSGVQIQSFVYGEDVSDSTLLLEITKNGIKFIHLSIHLCPKSFEPTAAGLIHFVKDVYKHQTSRSKRHLIYALIHVNKPLYKPKSLEFSIASGYVTHGISDTRNDLEIQDEMNVVISVLNRLFDEQNIDMYIGYLLYPVHDKMNLILRNINTFNSHVTRKNKGKYIFPTNTSSTIRLEPHIGNKKKRYTRKIVRTTRNHKTPIF